MRTRSQPLDPTDPWDFLHLGGRSIATSMLQLPLHLCSNFTYCPRVIWLSSNSVRLAMEAWGLYSRPVGLPSSQRAKHYYIYAPTSAPSMSRPSLHLCADRRAIWAPSSNFHFICTPTAAPSVFHLDLLLRVTGAASNSASYDKEAVGPSLASGKGVYLVRGLLGVLGRGCCWAGVRG